MSEHDQALEQCRSRLEAGDASALVDALALACAVDEVNLPRWLADAVLRAYGDLQAASAGQSEGRRATPGQQEDRDAAAHRHMLDLLRSTRPAQLGDAVHGYLRRGGLGVPVPPAIRLHEASSTVVLPITDAAGDLCALLLVEVGEAWRPGHPGPVALTELLAPLEGAAIRMVSPWLGEIGVAVGWESALCAWAGSDPPVPCDAVLNSDALASYQWAAHVRRLVIFARSHEMQQAHELARRARDSGLSVRFSMPSLPDWTWMDELVFSGAVPADEVAQRVMGVDAAGAAFGVEER